MPKAQAKKTTAETLEEKFERGEDVLDYFDTSKARVIRPQSDSAKSRYESAGRPNSDRRAVVREESPRYRKKAR